MKKTILTTLEEASVSTENIVLRRCLPEAFTRRIEGNSFSFLMLCQERSMKPVPDTKTKLLRESRCEPVILITRTCAYMKTCSFLMH